MKDKFAYVGKYMLKNISNIIALSIITLMMLAFVVEHIMGEIMPTTVSLALFALSVIGCFLSYLHNAITEMVKENKEKRYKEFVTAQLKEQLKIVDNGTHYSWYIGEIEKKEEHPLTLCDIYKFIDKCKNENPSPITKIGIGYKDYRILFDGMDICVIRCTGGYPINKIVEDDYIEHGIKTMHANGKGNYYTISEVKAK